MTRVRLRIAVGAASLALLALAGCGRRVLPRTGEQAEAKPAAPVSATMEHPTLKISDPKGAWRFEAVSKTLEAPGRDGPYLLTQAKGRFQQPGRPPVDMTANRVLVDKQAERIELEGAVRIAREGIVVEGERIAYDLKTGKVLADAPTKTTLGRRPAGAGAKPQTAATGEEP